MSLILVAYGCGKAEVTRSAVSDRPDTFIPLAHKETGSKAVGPPSQPAALQPIDLLSADVQIWESVDELSKPLAVFQHVFWEPADTTSFRKMVVSTGLVKHKTVLEIGTGSGLIALCCLEHGASSVVATDINPWAQKNALFNARVLQLQGRIEVRLVSRKTPDAWSVIGLDERFDVIFSNPPWQPGRPIHVKDFAFYDPDFQLMRTFLDELAAHLNPGGRAFLAYGCKEAVSKLKELAAARGLEVKIHDNRTFEQLPDLFLPGMLLEVVVSQ